MRRRATNPNKVALGIRRIGGGGRDEGAGERVSEEKRRASMVIRNGGGRHRDGRHPYPNRFVFAIKGP